MAIKQSQSSQVRSYEFDYNLFALGDLVSEDTIAIFLFNFNNFMNKNYIYNTYTRIFSVVLYGCETWPMMLMEEGKLCIYILLAISA
jgi:hypothetical protein